MLLFSASVFLWKPGIYVSSGVIISYMLVRAATDATYWRALRDSTVMRVSMALFVFGLITSLIAMQQADDFLWMARKTLFLPVAGFMFLSLEKAQNRKAALIGLLSGFWIAAVITIVENRALIGRDLIAGTWPKGTWDTLLGLFFVFLFLFLVGQKHGILSRLVIGVSALGAFVLLLFAGGRGPVLAIMFAVAVYLVFFKANLRVLAAVCAVAGALVVVSVSLFQDKTEFITQRLLSVTQIKDGSNWIRLKLPQIGYEHIKHLAASQPIALLFGSGSKSYNKTQLEFFETLPYDEDDRRRLKEFGYPTGDAHNNYIDSTLRHGLLWTIAAFAYLIWLSTRFKRRFVSDNPAPFALLLYMLVLGVIYTVLPHFATFFFVFFVALFTTMRAKEGQMEPGHSKSAG